jgi:hypothetical protein
MDSAPRPSQVNYRLNVNQPLFGMMSNDCYTQDRDRIVHCNMARTYFEGQALRAGSRRSRRTNQVARFAPPLARAVSFIGMTRPDRPLLAAFSKWIA